MRYTLFIKVADEDHNPSDFNWEMVIGNRVTFPCVISGLHFDDAYREVILRITMLTERGAFEAENALNEWLSDPSEAHSLQLVWWGKA